MMKAENVLAIIVTAYRANYLASALESIISQTDQRFNLYVFDDASPDSIEAIASDFASKRNLVFHRFERNLGGQSLVAHWERCIALTTEPWIWLFSDDDLMDPHCVASFLNEFNGSHRSHDIYRVNTRRIDAEGCLISENPSHPILETGSDFLHVRLQGKRTSTMQELVFSREAYAKVGGIPDFPLAWASDDAFIARMGLDHAIKTIQGPRVSWRRSGESISTNFSRANAKRKITASQMLVVWATEFLTKNPPSERPLSRSDLQELTSLWFFRRVDETETYLSLKSSLEIDRFASANWGWARGKGLMKCFKINRTLARRRFRSRAKLLLSPTVVRRNAV